MVNKRIHCPLNLAGQSKMIGITMRVEVVEEMENVERKVESDRAWGDSILRCQCLFLELSYLITPSGSRHMVFCFGISPVIIKTLGWDVAQW